MKATDRLVAAYNDSRRCDGSVQHELLGCYEPSAGRGLRCGCVPTRRRVERGRLSDRMRLIADSRQKVMFGALGGHTSNSLRANGLRTEISVKFTREQIAGELVGVGLDVVGQWTDPTATSSSPSPAASPCRPARSARAAPHIR